MSKRDQVAEALGSDLDKWLVQRRSIGKSWAAIAEEILVLTRVSVSPRAVMRWPQDRQDEARRQARELTRRHRRRYGSEYESKGRNRAAARALVMFREEHPDVWQRLLDEECGQFRALSVARSKAAKAP